MRAQEPERDPAALLYRSANDLFKARWETWVARSLIVAAAAHALLLAFWPSWSASERLVNFGGERFETALLSLGEASPTPPGMGPVALPILDGEAPAPEDGGGGDDDPEPDEELGRWDWEARGTLEAVRERLERSEPPVPTIVEPELEPEAEADPATRDAATEEEGRGTRIGGNASATDYLSSRMAGRLDLDRLSAARPELALSSPSSVILLRNPGQVVEFLRRRVSAGRWAVEARRLVSVTIWVDESGSVEWAEIGQSSGRPDIDEIALELFSDVVAFYPAREQGLRVPVSAIFWLTFPW
jgi:TonB family protein